MTSILIPGTLTDADLPADADLKTYLAGLSSVVYWGQADASHVTLASGAVSALKNVKGGSIEFAQATAGSRGSLAVQAGLDGYDAVTLDGTNDFYTYNDTFDFSGAFSVVTLATLTSLATQQTLINQYTGVSQQTGLIKVAGGGTAIFYHRGASVSAGVTYAAGVPGLFIGSFSGGTLRARSGAGSTASIAASGSVATGPLTLGKHPSFGLFWGGWLADVMLLNVDVLAAGNEQLLADITTYFRETYGLAI